MSAGDLCLAFPHSDQRRRASVCPQAWVSVHKINKLIEFSQPILEVLSSVAEISSEMCPGHQLYKLATVEVETQSKEKQSAVQIFNSTVCLLRMVNNVNMAPACRL